MKFKSPNWYFFFVALILAVGYSYHRFFADESLAINIYDENMIFVLAIILFITIQILYFVNIFISTIRKSK